MERGERSREARRGISPVIGVVLMVVIVVVLAGVVATVVLGLSDEPGGPIPKTAVDFEQTSAGIEVTPQNIGQEITVKVNGHDITTFDEGDAGQSQLLTVAPGDQIQIVATEDETQVIFQKEVQKDEAGDFIAYYSFEGQSGSSVEDQTKNSNSGSITGATWTEDGHGTAMSFDGSDDYVRVSDIGAAGTDVEEFTVAVAFTITDGSGVQQLIEHTHSPTGNEWFLETVSGYPGSSDDINYAVKYDPDPSNRETIQGGHVEKGVVHVAVGTYDGDTYTLYIDGTQVASDSYSRNVDMGALTIGRDHEQTIQHLDGRIYGVRLYYKAFEKDTVGILSEFMREGVSEKR